MIDWQDKVDRPKLACSATGQAIAHGETYFSALRLPTSAESQDRFERVDYCAAAWQGVDQSQLISWWRAQRPEAMGDDGPQFLSPEILLGIFRDVVDSTNRSQQCFAYLVGLLLMRNKTLRYLEVSVEQDETYLLLEDKRHKEVFKLRDPRMTPAEEEQVQGNLEDIFSAPVVATGAADE